MKLKSIIYLLEFILIKCFISFAIVAGAIAFIFVVPELIKYAFKIIEYAFKIIETAFNPIYNFLKFGIWSNTSLAELFLRKDPYILSEWIGLRKILFWTLDHITINFLCTLIVVLIVFSIIGVYDEIIDTLKKRKKEISKPSSSKRFKFSLANLKKDFREDYHNFLIEKKITKKYIKENVTLLEMCGYRNSGHNMWTNNEKKDQIMLSKEDLSEELPTEIKDRIREKKG